jgi:hypothetical protein
MVTFSDIVENVDNLSKDEIEELKEVVQLKWLEIRRREIADAVAEGRKEHEEGKTIVLSSPEEIKNYFLKLEGHEK